LSQKEPPLGRLGCVKLLKRINTWVKATDPKVTEVNAETLRSMGIHNLVLFMAVESHALNFSYS